MQIEQRDNTLTYKSSCTWFDDGQILIETATRSIWYGGLANFEEDIIISFHPLLKVHTHVILKYDLVFYSIHSMTPFSEYVTRNWTIYI